ncbi:N-acetylglucosamine-6-phosphate deacetylase [Pigmentibacter sp. JX0631]|uniref:N-acetylglucosamine-6-phosphate deacetylase n=1 Tax=Pigmentibacter sp. JX0631 TaxID=2976982 RepID=UPI0024698013|nr:N-acetylglucosamine-6-phosphate deacetylase [Pigmentibacter sp. JX0631]WGL59252.1 N-acetylglucosamine-6-phosphate deacetylase [Pigmentibacter sp. JX0631]
MLCIENALLFDGEVFKKNKKIFIKDKKIHDISNKRSSKKWKTIDAKDNIVCPGFIDIQVNGGGGFFFNDAISIEDIKKISLTHAKFGTTAFLPTFITDNKTKLPKFIQTFNSALKQKIPGIIGIHLEGPFINSDKKGIHAVEHIRSPTDSDFQELKKIINCFKVITIAPEKVSKEFINILLKNNFNVFAGHTLATFDEMQNGINLGIKGITHLFNACSQLGSREPGVIGAFILNEKPWAGIIADGYHVSFDTLKVVLKAKEAKKFILVSDAMAPVGTKLDKFKIYTKEIFVKEGKYIDKSGTLAGSALTIHQALQNILQHKLVSVSEALQMTSTNAADCLGINKKNKIGLKGMILPNFDADIVILNKKNFNLLNVIQLGEVIS